MTDRDAFLRAIIAAPDDDLPRLVFADWLDDHGEGERAEFIRVQCEQFKGETQNGGSWATDCKAAAQWFPELGPVLVSDRGECYLIRGFVDTVCCSSASWLAHGDAITRQHPVRTVRLTDRPGVSEAWTPLGGPTTVRMGPYQIDGRTCWFEGSASSWDRAVQFALQARWPGVTFELPVETWGNGMPMIRATPFVSDEEARVLNGDPTADAPAGIIFHPTR